MSIAIHLPEDLVRRAEALAAEAGVSLTAFVEHAVRDRVEQPRPEAERHPPLPVSKETGWVRPGVNMDKVSELFMQEDLTDGKFR